MKTIIIAVLLGVFSVAANAQTTSTDTSLSTILISYYGLKNALVSGDEVIASSSATTFMKKINAADTKGLSSKEQKAFNAVKEKLVLDAEHIAESKDIAHQRDHFASLSLNLSSLAKAIKLSDSPIYKEYCPMKKSYWLSSEAVIKNPYYGKTMLTCGSVSEVIK